MNTAEAIAQAFASHNEKSARAIGLHVWQSHVTSRLELRNSITSERIRISGSIDNSAIASAATEALAAIAAERKRLENAKRQAAERRGPQTDRARAEAALASVARAS